EEMARGLVVTPAVERPLRLRREDAGGTLLRPGPGDVQLGPVAGRKADGLAVVARELACERRRVLRCEGDTLAHLERRAVMRDPNEGELRQPVPSRAATPSAARARADAPRARRPRARVG